MFLYGFFDFVVACGYQFEQRDLAFIPEERIRYSDQTIEDLIYEALLFQTQVVQEESVDREAIFCHSWERRAFCPWGSCDHDNDYVYHDADYDFTDNQIIIVVIFTRLLRYVWIVTTCHVMSWGQILFSRTLGGCPAWPTPHSELSKGSLDQFCWCKRCRRKTSIQWVASSVKLYQSEDWKKTLIQEIYFTKASKVCNEFWYIHSRKKPGRSWWKYRDLRCH